MSLRQCIRFIALFEVIVAIPLAPSQTPAQPPADSIKLQLDNGLDLTKVTMAQLEDSSYRLGQPDAPVTVVEFADFMCPACHKTHLKLLDFVAHNKGKVSLIYRQFPLTHVHKLALYTSTLSEQLGAGDFWAFAEKVYRSNKGLTKKDLDKIYASFTGRHARSEQAAKDKVDKDVKFSHDLNVHSTPTCIFCIGQKPVAVTSTVSFQEIVSRPEFARILKSSAP